MWTSNSRLAGANRRIGYKSFQLLAYSLQLCSTLDSYGIPEIAYQHFHDSINAAQSSNIKPTTFSKLVKRQMWQRVKCKAVKPLLILRLVSPGIVKKDVLLPPPISIS